MGTVVPCRLLFSKEVQENYVATSTAQKAASTVFKQRKNRSSFPVWIPARRWQRHITSQRNTQGILLRKR